MRETRFGLWRAYRIPLPIALASLAGLASALIGDGPFDLLSWIVLGSLIVLIAVLLRR